MNPSSRSFACDPKDGRRAVTFEMLFLKVCKCFGSSTLWLTVFLHSRRRLHGDVRSSGCPLTKEQLQQHLADANELIGRELMEILVDGDIALSVEDHGHSAMDGWAIENAPYRYLVFSHLVHS